MTVKLNTNLVPIFSGTYNTPWEVEAHNDNGDELYCEYDFSEFMTSIQEAYEAKSLDIVRDLELDWIKAIKFTGHNSPREYNFSTDTLDFELEIDQVGLLKAVTDLSTDIKFEKWLAENFTDRDGFWSWTPNSYTGIFEAIYGETDKYHQALGAVIQWLAKDALEGDWYNTIEGTVHEYWQGNGYMGLNYTESEAA